MADYPLDKVSIRPRGAYTSNTTYNFLDAVQDRGGTWLSLVASKDIEPGVTSGWQSYWMALAQGIQSVDITSQETGKATITVTYSNGTSTSITIDTSAIPAGGVGTNELAPGSVTAPKIAANAVSQAYTTTLNTTWSGSAAPYTKVQTISGILATDTPIIDLVPSATFADATKQEDAWANVYRAVTAANQITFYAKAKPTVSIPLQIRCIRK